MMMIGVAAQEDQQQELIPEGAVDADGDFIATDQWQKVPEGAAVPGVRAS